LGEQGFSISDEQGEDDRLTASYYIKKDYIQSGFESLCFNNLVIQLASYGAIQKMDNLLQNYLATGCVALWGRRIPVAEDAVLQRACLAFRQDSYQGALAEYEFACAQVPYFQGRLVEGRTRPDAAGDLAMWMQIPLTRRSDYRVHFPRRVLARGTTLRECGTLKTQSTGRGDDSVTTIAHIDTLAARTRVTSAANPALRAAILVHGLDGPERPHRSARYAAPACSDLECANPYTGMHDRIQGDGTLVLPTTTDPLATPDTLVDRAIAELRAYSPRWLQVDATHFAFLLRAVGKRGASALNRVTDAVSTVGEEGTDGAGDLPSPRVDAIVLAYSPATRVARRQIAERFGEAIMVEVVTMSEFGWLTVECPLGFTHFNNVSYFPEFLSEQTGTPARPGELAELVLTSIGDRLMPHIRYRTGDLYRVWDEPCKCGSDLPICRHEGRRGTLLTLPGRASPISARDVDRAVGACPELDVYQVRQHREDTVRVEYVPNVKDTRASEAGLAERLRFLLGPRTRLEIAAVGYLPAERSGRVPPCVSELPGRRSDRSPAQPTDDPASPPGGASYAQEEAAC